MFNQSIRFCVSLLVVLTASACGEGAATGGAGMEMNTATAGAATGAPAMETTATAGGMEMETTATAGGMEMETTATAAGMEGMDHGSMEASKAPFDAQFIDSMIEHHDGAIAMAQQALTESERPEIKELAQKIIASQQQEVEQMKTWRTEWYPDVEPTGGMGMDMGDMELSADAGTPFDQRFITAMIGHHQGASAMAQEAQTKAEHAELKTLAGQIITAQEAEIAQMQAWEQQWFGS